MTAAMTICLEYLRTRRKRPAATATPTSPKWHTTIGEASAFEEAATLRAPAYRSAEGIGEDVQWRRDKRYGAKVERGTGEVEKA